MFYRLRALILLTQATRGIHRFETSGLNIALFPKTSKHRLPHLLLATRIALKDYFFMVPKGTQLIGQFVFVAHS